VKYRKDGQENTIQFDFAVVATGSSYTFPAKCTFDDTTQAKEFYGEIADRIKDAASILIIGGGPVGVEFAGEIATEHPGKKVTLIHAGDTLISTVKGLHPKFREKVNIALRELHVEVILGERIVFTDELGDQLRNSDWKPIEGHHTFQTDKGKNIETDLFFVCTGAKPNTSFLRNHFEGVIDDQKRVKVNPYFQIEGHQNIFALGDITNIPEVKLAFVIEAHVPLVTNNIKQLIQGQNGKLKSYTPKKDAMALTIGKERGVTQFGSLPVLGNTLTKAIKSKDLFSSRNWAKLNQKYPNI